MAKHCIVCNQTYVDHLQSCPHCAEAVEVIDPGAAVEISDPDVQGVVVELPDADAEIIRGGKKLSDSHSEVDLNLADASSGEPNSSNSDSGFDLPFAPPAEKSIGTSSAVDIGLSLPKTSGGSESDVALGSQGPVSADPSMVWASTVEPEGVDFGEQPKDQVAIDSPSDVDLLKVIQSQEAAASPPPAVPPVPNMSSPESAVPSGLRLVGDALEEDNFSGLITGGIHKNRGGQTQTARPDGAPKTHTSEGESALNLADMGSSSRSTEPVGSGVDLSEKGPGQSDASLLKGAGAYDDSAVDLGSSMDTGPGASEAPRARTDLAALSGRSLYQSESELELNVDAIDEEIDLPSHVVVTEPQERTGEDKGYARESMPSAGGLVDSYGKRTNSRRGLLTGAGIGAVGGLALASILWMGGVEPPASWRMGGSANKNKPNADTPNTTLSPNTVPPVAAALDPAMIQNLKDQGFEIEADAKPADVVVVLLSKQTQLQNDAKASKDQADKAVKDFNDLSKKGGDAVAMAKKELEKDMKALQVEASAAKTQAKETADKLKAAEDEAKTAKADSAKYAALLKTNAEELKAIQEKAGQSGDKTKAIEDQNRTLSAELKKAETQFQLASGKIAEFTKQIDQLKASRQDADAKLIEVGKRLEDAKIVGAKPDLAEIVKGVERLLTLAKTTDPQGQLAVAKQETQKYQAALAQRHTPQEMLAIWLPVLTDRASKDNANKALYDVDRVLKEGVSPAAKAEALTVQGLALRNQGKFAEARAALEKALQDKGANPAGPSRVMAQTAFKELTDPNAFYLPRIEQLQAAGDYGAALDELNQALKVFDKDTGHLLALRATVYLDSSLAKAKSIRVQSDNDMVVAARKDAQGAVAAGAVAEGHYVLGRVAEEVGNTDEARQAYQKALDAKPDNRYRLALARVLLKLHQERTRQASRSAETETERARSPLASLIVLIDLGMLADESTQSAERDEANHLADQVLASTKDDPASLLLKGQALAIKGQWTQALSTYVEGLRPRLKRGEADDLLLMISSLPAMKRPETVGGTDMEQADHHYAAGLRLFASHRYADAEKEFAYAVQSFANDARYFYYLGLSRLMEGRPAEASDAFEQAAKLERKNQPDRATVNIALERVQGTPRRELEKVRH